MAQTWHWHQASTAIASFGLAGFCFTAIPSSAQIAPDQTLGTESSNVSPNATVRGFPADLIRGGATRGVNLFHSFSQFNVRDGQRVYFANPVGIETILSRVTGANPSRIFGTLGVDGTANLFLINPNGILFGPNARLDVAGSFLASTANSFKFPDGSEFSATNPQAPPLLTVNIRPGLQYGPNHQATIANAGNLTAGKDLTLAAGNLDLQGQLQSGGDLTLRALDTVKVRDSITTPFIATAGGKLMVQGDRAIDIFALNHPNSGFFSGGDLVLRSANPISGDAHYITGGGLRFEQLNGTPGSLISLDDPVLLVNGDVFLGDYVGPSLHIVAGGNVFLGNVTITAPATDGLIETIRLSDGTSLAIDGVNFPTLDVRAGFDWAGLPIFSNSGVGFPLVTSFPFTPLVSNPTGSTISVGSITNTNGIGSIYLSNQYFPSSLVPAGSIFTGSINTFGDIVIDSRGGIFTGGAIDTNIGSGFGNSGNIRLLANGNIVTGGSVESSVKVGGIGNAGDITLLSRFGSINTQAGFVNSSTGLGFSGNITFTAFDNITTSADAPNPNGDNIPAVGSYVGANGIGIAGNITLTSIAGGINTSAGTLNSASPAIGVSGNIILTATGNIIPGNINSSSAAPGKAGDIELNSQSDVIVVGRQIESTTFGNNGRAGDIRVRARSLFLDGALIKTSTQGVGDAGNISVTASDQVILSNESGIRALVEAGASGRAGDIDIQARSLQVYSSQIGSALFREYRTPQGQLLTPGAQGSGGSIRINTSESVILSGTTSDGFASGLIALTERGAFGPAGDVAVTTGLLRIDNGAVIAAGTRNPGSGGDITLRVNVLEIFSGGRVQVNSDGTGRGGSIDITADRVAISGLDTNYLPRRDRIEQYLDRPSPFIPLQLSPRDAGETVDDVFGGIVNPYSGLFANTSGFGSAGDIKLQARVIDISEVGTISADTSGSFAGGNITLQTQSLSLFSGGSINARTFGAGKGGDIQVDPLNPEIPALITLSGVAQFPYLPLAFTNITQLPLVDGAAIGGFSSGISSNSEDGATGAGGSITLNTDRLRIADGAVVSARARSAGNGGNITLNVDTLDLLSGGQVITPTFGSGAAGGINVNASGTVSISGFDPDFLARFGQVKQAWQTLIDLRLVSADSNAQTRTRFTIDPIDAASGLRTTVEPEAIANLSNLNIGGKIDVRAGSLSLSNFGSIAAGTSGFGNAGQISIQANNEFSLSENSSIRGSVEQRGTGNGGDIFVAGRSLTLASGGQIQSGVFRAEDGVRGGIGNAGSIQIRTSDFVTIAGEGTNLAGNTFKSGIFVSTEFGAKGTAGNLFVETGTLQILDRGLVNASTSNEFNAGSIIFKVADNITLANEALISVSGLSTGNPGNIEITSGGSLIMKNGSAIQATTASGENANIAVSVRGAITMGCCGNEISAQARGVGNGGNISISALAVITFLEHNNDIVANAEDGRGGNITITSPFFKGLSNRDRRQGDLLRGGSVRVFREGKIRTLESDITASSEFGVDGIVDIPGDNQFELLPQLPATFRDITDLVTSKCSYGEKGRSRFVSTGRGGIAPSPTDPLSDESVPADWVSVPATGDRTSRATPTQTAANQPLTEIVEAQGWVKEADGTISLIAYTSNAVPNNSWLRSPECDEKRQVK